MALPSMHASPGFPFPQTQPFSSPQVLRLLFPRCLPLPPTKSLCRPSESNYWTKASLWPETPSETMIKLCCASKSFFEALSFTPRTASTDSDLPHLLYRRFLRARKYDLVQAKKMFQDCQHWRKTVYGVGIDKLYDQMDPFDVRNPLFF